MSSVNSTSNNNIAAIIAFSACHASKQGKVSKSLLKALIKNVNNAPDTKLDKKAVQGLQYNYMKMQSILQNQNSKIYGEKSELLQKVANGISAKVTEVE